MRTLALFLWVSVLAFAIKLAEGEIENGFADLDSDPKILKVSVIDEPTANALFRKFVEAKHIPFKYPVDGCYARATEMALIAEKEKIEMGKVYAEGWLQAKTESEDYPRVQWGWHVAPVVYVKRGENKTKLMVFDPSLFKRPVTVEEWKRKMMERSDDFEPDVERLYFGSRFQYKSKSEDERYKSGWSERDLLDKDRVLTRHLHYQESPSSVAPDDLEQEHQGVQ